MFVLMFCSQNKRGTNSTRNHQVTIGVMLVILRPCQMHTETE